MKQKEKNRSKAKCHQCLPTYRLHAFICSEMMSGSFGKYNSIHTTVVSSCSANGIMLVTFPLSQRREKGKREDRCKSLGNAAIQCTHHGSGGGERRYCSGSQYLSKISGNSIALCSTRVKEESSVSTGDTANREEPSEWGRGLQRHCDSQVVLPQRV